MDWWVLLTQSINGCEKKVSRSSSKEEESNTEDFLEFQPKYPIIVFFLSVLWLKHSFSFSLRSLILCINKSEILLLYTYFIWIHICLSIDNSQIRVGVLWCWECSKHMFRVVNLLPQLMADQTLHLATLKELDIWCLKICVVG